MLPHRRTLLAVAVTAAAALGVAGPAAADSIVFIKDGNVWLTSPDGAKSYAVTSDGGYSSPSQADDGTIAALQGKSFVRMDPSGRQLNAPVAGMGTPPVPANDFFGPYEPRISPDGKRIAYWFGQYSDYFSRCGLPWCCEQRHRGRTSTARSSRVVCTTVWVV